MPGNARDGSDDFAAWFKGQREVLERLAQERDPARLRSELEGWWRRASAHASPQAHELASRLFDLGQDYLQGVQQFARVAAGEAAAAGKHEDSGFNFGLDLLAAWRAARWGSAAAAEAGTALFAPWLEVLAQMSATGPAREYVQDARELASLHAECQRLEASLGVILQRVQHEALVDLQQQVAARAQLAEPIRSFQQLYTLWIECGERAYAQAAHDAEFIRLQAEFANRALRMRNVQRRLAERMARALDLPTRGEVNALHLQVRDLKRRLNEMSTAAGAASQQTAKAKSAKKRRV